MKFKAIKILRILVFEKIVKSRAQKKIFFLKKMFENFIYNFCDFRTLIFSYSVLDCLKISFKIYNEMLRNSLKNLQIFQ